MGQALYRTYRSKKLSEIVGQEHITAALDHALKKGTISHAYLFTGPRGVGKTSIARILAHEINGLPYTEDRTNLDIIEIDAASNRRIDEIRDLRDKVHIAPSSAKYKVYIIDEVHMLTKEAFNALLKTLEEPPAHVVFILATTEAHKLPETIISRTQRYSFKPGSQPKVIGHLRYIANQEKIDITEEALVLIAAHGEGSFRDSVSLLDQVRNKTGKISLDDVQAVLGIASEKLIYDITIALQNHDSISVAKNLKIMHDQGYEPAQIAKQIATTFRHAILDGESLLKHEIALKLLGDLVQVPASPDPRIALEIALLDAALSGVQVKIAPAAAPISAEASFKVMSEEVKTKPAIQEAAKRVEKIEKTNAAQTTEKDTPAPETAQKPAVAEKKATPKPTTPLESAEVDSDLVLTDEAWQLVLNAIKQKHNTLYSMLNSAKPQFESGKVTLEFSYAFHQKRLNETHNKEKVSHIIQGVTGSAIQIICIVGEGKPRVAPSVPLPPADGEIIHNADPKDNPKPSTITTISDIFGGAEVLES